MKLAKIQCKSLHKSELTGYFGWSLFSRESCIPTLFCSEIKFKNCALRSHIRVDFLGYKPHSQIVLPSPPPCWQSFPAMCMRALMYASPAVKLYTLSVCLRQDAVDGAFSMYWKTVLELGLRIRLCSGKCENVPTCFPRSDKQWIW